MNRTLHIGDILQGIFALVLLATGVLNMILVHPVPGIIYIILSFIYIPTADVLLKKRLGFSIPLVIKIIMGIAIIMFTLGVSDLGNMIDKL